MSFMYFIKFQSFMESVISFSLSLRVSFHSHPSLLVYTQPFTEGVIGLGMAASGKFIMTCTGGGSLALWDVQGQLLCRRELGSTCVHAALSSDGRCIAVCTTG